MPALAASNVSYEKRVHVMTSRVAGLLAVLLAAPMFGCQNGSWDRVHQDLVVVATSPATIPINGVYDALDWYPQSRYAERWEPECEDEPIPWQEEYADTAAAIAWAPLTIPGHMVKHGAYTLAHALDLVVSPFYLLADTCGDDDCRGLPPMNIYDTCEYPWRSRPAPYWEDDRGPFFWEQAFGE